MTAAAKKPGTAPAAAPAPKAATVATAVTVRALTPIRHGADSVAEGETFACDPDEAALLIAQGAAKAARAN